MAWKGGGRGVEKRKEWKTTERQCLGGWGHSAGISGYGKLWFVGENGGGGYAGLQALHPHNTLSPPPPDLELFLPHCREPCAVFSPKVKIHFLQAAFRDCCDQPLATEALVLSSPYLMFVWAPTASGCSVYMFQGAFRNL